MQNFNTNQTRHFYAARTGVANDKAYDEYSAGDIALKSTADGKKIFFTFKNYDDEIVRTDTIDVDKVRSVKLATADSMDKPLIGYNLALKSGLSISSLEGSEVKCTVTIHQLFDYDDDNTVSTSVVLTVPGTTDALYKKLAIELANSLPCPVKKHPIVNVYLDDTLVKPGAKLTDEDIDALSSITSISVVPGLPKYARGKLSCEPCPISVSFVKLGSNYEQDESVLPDDINDYKLTVAEIDEGISPAVVSGSYQIADLEYFALGERGDMLRGYRYPDDYDTHYEIDVTKRYDMLSIDYFWAGNAENVQKSPRLLEIALPTNATKKAAAFLAEIQAILDGKATEVAADVDALELRVQALEEARPSSGNGGGGTA